MAAEGHYVPVPTAEIVTLPDSRLSADEVGRNLADQAATDSPRSSESCSVLLGDGLQPFDEVTSPVDHPRSLTFFNGLGIVIGLQIGSGIFAVPSSVSSHVSSPGAGVLVWLVCGLLVWTGAASFVELGTSIPRNGGIQEYLEHCYGDFSGFLFSWIWISISKPCAMAVASMIFAEHLIGAVLPVGLRGIFMNKVVALLANLSVAFLNCLGTKTGPSVGNAFLLLKLFAISSIVLVGLIFALNGHGAGVYGDRLGWFDSRHPSDRNSETTQMPIWSQIGQYVTAAFAVLFCYGGWESIGFVAGEMKDPLRDLPRVINTSMSIVTSGFVLMNMALYIVLPMHVIRENKAAALSFGEQVFGLGGLLLYSLIVAISSLGSINANIFATGRLCAVASKRRYFPRLFGDPICESREQESRYYREMLKDYPRWVAAVCIWIIEFTASARWEKHVPIYAMTLIAAFTSFYIIIGSFSALLTFIGLSEFIIFFFAVFGIFRLRANKEPNPEKTYTARTFNPIIFCIVSAFLVFRGVFSEPWQGVAILVTAAVGLVVYRRVFPSPK